MRLMRFNGGEAARFRATVPWPPRPPGHPLSVSEAEIDAVIEEAKGDPREAIRTLIRDLAMMAVDAETKVSRGAGALGQIGACRRLKAHQLRKLFRYLNDLTHDHIAWRAVL
jgi:hypothetical protein